MRELLIKLIKSQIVHPIVTGSVESVDEGAGTCVVTPSDGGAAIHNVRLRAVIDGQSSGMVMVPTGGSSVVVGYIMGDDTNPCLVQCSEIDKLVVTIGDNTVEVNRTGISIGSPDGSAEKAVLGDTLQRQLNNLKQQVELLYSALRNSPTVPQDGGSAYKTAIVAALAPAPAADFTDILSQKTTLD